MRLIKIVSIATLILFHLSLFEVKSQTEASFKLIGISGRTGLGYGNIFKIDSDGSNLVRPKVFEGSPDGASPNGRLIYHSGYLYGMTRFGGSYGYGAIVKMKPDGSDYHNIFSFDRADGINPSSGLTLGSDENFYGTNSKFIFRIKPDGTQFTTLLDFSLSTIGPLKGNLLQGSDGVLYGITGDESIFKINKDGTGSSIIFNFDRSETGIGSENLIEGTDGYLYCMTNHEAGNNSGAIFKLKKDGSGYSKLIDIRSGTNSNYILNQSGIPLGSLIQAIDGNLYGINPVIGDNDKGSLFRIETNGSNYTELVEFNGVNGETPIGSLTQITNGELYGTTLTGGVNNLGIAYKINPDGSGFSKLFDFDITNSGYIKTYNGSRQLFELNGKLIGAVAEGAQSNNGIFYNIDTNGAFTILKTFSQDLAVPDGYLLLASDGMLYGTAFSGGDYGYGGIYRMKSDGSDYNKIFSFDKSNGAFYCNGLLEGNDSFLFGTTSTGGANDKGVLFKIKMDGSGFLKLIDFDGVNGGRSYGSLTLASNGFFYGVGSFGGINGKGNVFRIKQDGTDFQVILNFDDYYFPDGTLIEATDGNLYGQASSGGLGDHGGIFKIDLNGDNYQQIFDFDNTNGYPIQGINLFQAPNGRLYTMIDNFNDDGGAIISINLDGSGLIKHYNFEETGRFHGGITLAPDGFLYGTRSGGGSDNRGFAFKVKLDGTQYTKFFDFTYDNGAGSYNPPTVVLDIKSSQLITFNPLESKLFSSGDFILSANSDSGLPITYTSSNTAVATISGSTVTLIGIGTTTITASQAGNSQYAAATSVEQQLVVNKGEQTITFPSIAERKFKDDAFNLTATSNSNLELTYTSDNSEVATITNNTVTIVGAGTATITASQAGDDHYLPAPEVKQELTITKANQTITFSALSDKIFGTSTFVLSASSSSELPVNFRTESDKITIIGDQVTLAKAGRVSIEATQIGNTNYLEASVVTQSFCINPVKPNITITSADQSTLSSSATIGNQWYLNGVAIDGAVNATFTASQAGVYTVQTQMDDCKSEISPGISLVITGDIYTSSKEIKLYPNPATQQLTISLPDDRSAKEIMIYSMDGKLIEQVNTSETKITLSINTYLSGTYFLRIISGDKQFNKRFIKK